MLALEPPWPEDGKAVPPSISERTISVGHATKQNLAGRGEDPRGLHLCSTLIHLSVAQPIQARVEAAALPCLQTARGPGPILTAQQTESGLDVSIQEP